VVAKVYLIEGNLSADELELIRRKLLADPVAELTSDTLPSRGGLVEVHPLPGVMDPAAQSVRDAITDLTGRPADVSTGIRYDIPGLTNPQAESLARRSLCNPVIHAVYTSPFHPKELPKGHEQPFQVRHVPIRELTDEQLMKMSREAHLFLSLDEMKAVQAEYRALGREPRDIELETIAQTWSEHCVHKTLKSTVRYRSGRRNDPIRWEGRPGHTINSDGSVTIRNLLKSTVAAATFELIEEGCDWALSVFKDNSGVVALDDAWGVNIKVETHNRPSAIEPYGGSATGIGGCIRDVIGTGLGAKPIASTDVFCVAHPNLTDLPPGCLPPRRILTDVVAGIRDYGNRMGIPTVSGNVSFDNRHVGNPLVFAGCVGLIPRHLIKGRAMPGDRIVALGGHTGRDGVHGATFSSAELESTASTEFAHAVQIGNAIEEKRLLDAILRARDEGPLYHAITDCGAGGFSSAVGEMGGEIGAEVHLDRAPLKYAGLTYTEIWISEAQERMILAVPESSLPRLRRICEEEGVPLADLGTFGTPGAELVLYFRGTEVGRLPMAFLHEGIPMPTREAADAPVAPLSSAGPKTSGSIEDTLTSLLRHPNLASKHWIIRQYDHEVQGGVVCKPLVGPGSQGPGDAAVIEPVAGTGRGIALSQGLQTPVGDPALGGDAYLMALAAVDEVVRNLVCVGADPGRIAILDNFCWPSCADARNMASLVRAAEGCYDAAKAYRTPFVSGKDSLNNQLRYTDSSGTERVIEIPPTLLITGLGLVPDIRRTVTMDAKRAGNVVVLAGGATTQETGASHAAMLGLIAAGPIPKVDLTRGPAAARAVAGLIREGGVRSAHDCSEGGMLAAVAEMLIATGGGRTETLGFAFASGLSPLDPSTLAFSENPSRYVLEIEPQSEEAVRAAFASVGLHCLTLGTLDRTGRLRWADASLDVPVERLARAWREPLDW
jgi:phosphoribosylformylglycinamidine synthase